MCRISMTQLCEEYVKTKIYMYTILSFTAPTISSGDAFNFKVSHLKRSPVRHNSEISYLRMP